MKKITLISTVLCAVLFFNNVSAAAIVKHKNNMLSAPKAENYQWYLNGELLNGVNQREIIIQQRGTYTVQFLNKQGIKESLNYMFSNSAGKVRKLFVIGDSTASEYGSGSYPRTGWGQVLQPFFKTDSVVVIDKALSGRSSKSFYTDANGWPMVLKDLSKGDLLFIQFGHNDSKSDEERHTDPYTTYKDYLSIYIDTALARGAYPVLLTSIHRNGWSGDQISDSHGDYPPAMRQLATERNIPLIDLHQLTEQRWEELGKDYVTNNIYNNLSAGIYNTYPTGNEDNTHLQEEGAWEVCKLITNDIDTKKADNFLGKIANNLLKAGMIKVISEPGMSCAFKGAGVVTTETEVSISASPLSGYALSHWEIKGVNVSSDAIYAFTAEDTLLNVTGVCKEGFKVSVSRDPLKGGRVSGSGSFVEGAEVTLTAESKEGYQFVNWTLSDVVVGTDTTLTVTVVAEDVKYIAHFEEILSVLNLEDPQSIKVFPNPASDILNVFSEQPLQRIKIYDITGKLVYVSIPFSNETAISIDRLNNGIYMVQLKTSDAIVQQKICVSR